MEQALIKPPLFFEREGGGRGNRRSWRQGSTTLHALSSDRTSRESPLPLKSTLSEMPPPAPSAGERRLQVARQYFAMNNMETIQGEDPDGIGRPYGL